MSAPIKSVRAESYTIPTDFPEADGTFAWTATTIVLVEVDAGGKTGIGYTYASAAAAAVINETLADAVCGLDAMDPPRAWRAMQRVVRNIGRGGLAATAISAVDIALWDLKAKSLGMPLARVLGRYRDQAAIYGSGGFTTYDDQRLQRQLGEWVEEAGCRWVKMKVGSAPENDVRRARTARDAIGAAGLFVDANGAFSVKQSQAMAEAFANEAGVSWFEEPVSSDDVAGLRQVRAGAPAGMEIAAGEYAYDLDAVRELLERRAVDVLQADASRCGGVIGFLHAAALCEAHHVDLSAHCAPALHLHLACAAPRFRHLEWFHDHVRIERMLFDGAPMAKDGMVWPDMSRPGLGLDFKRQDAEKYAV